MLKGGGEAMQALQRNLKLNMEVEVRKHNLIEIMSINGHYNSDLIVTLKSFFVYIYFDLS